jgi:hypothetical protein
MRWPMRDACLWETRLWDGLCEKHAYKRRVHEMAANEMAPCEKHVYERHAHEMADGRYTPMGEVCI